MTGPTLTAPFKNTQELSKGGQKFTYVPAAEVVERLNACLGYGNWSFAVLDAFHQPQDDPQYVVAKGRLEAQGGVYEQFGGQTPNRYSRNAAEHLRGTIIDLADDYKGAASDALKKCAAMIGVGLYLSLKRGPTPNEQIAGDDQAGNAPAPARHSSGADPTPDPAGGEQSPPPATSSGLLPPSDAERGSASDGGDHAIESMQSSFLKKQIAALKGDAARAWLKYKTDHALPLNPDDYSDEHRSTAAAFFEAGVPA